MPKELLTILNSNYNSWISGEEISRQLGITRSAIWKKIKNLRDSGYIIEAVPNKGYCLVEKPDVLIPGEISDGLQTEFIGKKEIFYFDEIASTNDYAKNVAAKNAPEGTLVIAENQNSGRGRKGRTWHSVPYTGLYISIVLRPVMQPHEVSQITLMTAVAVFEAIDEHMELSLRIKWPNDILVNDKKISGILTEMDCSQDAINYVVIGIGINVNAPESDFPDELSSVATSLSVETGKKISRVVLLLSLLKKFEYYYALLQQKQMAIIISQWKKKSAVMGKKVKVDLLDCAISGKVFDVSSEGFLIIEDNDGLLHEVISGDVTFI